MQLDNFVFTYRYQMVFAASHSSSLERLRFYLLLEDRTEQLQLHFR